MTESPALTTDTPQITSVLRSKGRNTLGHETNLARSPIWQVRPHATDERSIVASILFGHPFRKVEGRPLTATDQRLFAHLTTAYIRLGCPTDRHVPFSLTEAASILGHDPSGGKQRSLVRTSLARLRSATFESALRHPDGQETLLGWGLIDHYLVTTSGNGKGRVQLSEPVAKLLDEGNVTFLHGPTWTAICSADEVAGRLWSFLESESIGNGWRFPVFGSNDGQRGRTVPPIAELLQLSWSSKKKVAHRLRAACAVIEEYDRRYRLNVVAGRKEGTWLLECARTALPGKARIDALPDVVTQAWKGAYRRRVPSRRQREVLVEVLGRRSPEWVAAQLGSTDNRVDPFRSLLAADASRSRDHRTALRSAEDRWEADKARENADSEQSLAEIIQAVRDFADRSD